MINDSGGARSLVRVGLSLERSSLVSFLSLRLVRTQRPRAIKGFEIDIENLPRQPVQVLRAPVRSNYSTEQYAIHIFSHQFFF